LGRGDGREHGQAIDAGLDVGGGALGSVSHVAA
jgi:hypothetical protein